METNDSGRPILYLHLENRFPQQVPVNVQIVL